MFSTLRNRFGIPGVISVIALVFALVGGAFAANNLGGSSKGATASAKKAAKGPRGPRGATGPGGPAGAAGPAGPKGDNGAAGANGSNGSDGTKGATGTNGQSVTTAVEPPFGECGEQEGVELTSASGTDYVCNGAEGAEGSKGDPWTAGGTLPVGATQTGTWVLADQSPEYLVGGFLLWNVTPISFPIPLKKPLDASHVFFVKAKGEIPSQCNDPDHPGTPSLLNPEAVSGNLCVFGLESEPEPEIFITDLEFVEGTHISGALLLKSPETVKGSFVGSFAVTG